MNTKDITLTLIIFFIFIALFLYNILGVQLGNIKKNWNLRKCEPLVMPFAGMVGPPGTDTGKNFADCMKSTQKGLMSQLLQPMEHNMSSLGSLGSQLTSSLSDMKGLTSNIRTHMGNITGSIFGVVVNFIIYFSKIIGIFNRYYRKSYRYIYCINGYNESYI